MVELVAMIAGELVPNFWRPNRQPAQDASSSSIFSMLMKSRLMPTPQIEVLTDKEFWLRVERAMPDWEQRKAFLSSRGIEVEGL
jgi:hypothetical protein